MNPVPVPAPPDPAQVLRLWPPLHASARALALAQAARADRRLWVVLADDARRLDQLRRELLFFAGPDLPVLQLPDWEVLPYDRYSPVPDLVSERIATLARLPAMGSGVLLVGAETLLHGVFAKFRDEWSSWQAIVSEWLDAGHSIVALGEYRGTHRVTGKSIVASFAHVYNVRETRIARFRQFTDTALIRAAMAR